MVVFFFPVEFSTLFTCRCYLKLGDWCETLQGYTEASIPRILRYYAAATEHHRAWYRAWHAYAIMNYQAVLFYKSAVTDAQQASGEDSAGADNNLKEMVRLNTSYTPNNLKEMLILNRSYALKYCD